MQGRKTLVGNFWDFFPLLDCGRFNQVHTDIIHARPEKTGTRPAFFIPKNRETPPAYIDLRSSTGSTYSSFYTTI